METRSILMDNFVDKSVKVFLKTDFHQKSKRVHRLVFPLIILLVKRS